MPSPIWTTEPTSRVSTADEKFLICSMRMELISSVGAAIDSFFSARAACQRPPQAFESSGDAIVDQWCPDPRDDAANDLGVNSRVDGHLVGISVQIRGQSLGHQSFHFGVQWHSSGDVGRGEATALV